MADEDIDEVDEGYYNVTFELSKRVYGRKKDFQRVAAEMEKHLQVAMHDKNLTVMAYYWDHA